MSDMAAHNLAAYEADRPARRYQQAEGLQPPEVTILADIGREFTGKRILDIGVGGGRTTEPLRAISPDYLGVDYSAQMIAKSRARHPHVRFDVCDARDLSRFSDASFDLIAFTYNGLDYIGHADRLTALREIRRVLTDQGCFFFSSHNRYARDLTSPWRAFTPCSPLALPRNIASYALGIINHYRHRRRQISRADFAVLNDRAQHFALLTYYIAPESQIAQLETVGFKTCYVVGTDGQRVAVPDGLKGKTDGWLYYVCRKSLAA